MTKQAIRESIRNAKIELDQLKNSPMQCGFSNTQHEIHRFIIDMERELHEK